jgi:antitoxin VapB
MDKAKIFKNGSSQAVRLPKEFRFEGEEVYIKKTGNTIQLIPMADSWDALFSSLDQFSDDYMQERQQPPLDEREGF